MKPIPKHLMPEKLEDFADLVLRRAMAMMTENGVPLDVLVDRLTTAAAGIHAQAMGDELAARCFHDYADRIGQGLFTASRKARAH